jgi:hypothetical protein
LEIAPEDIEVGEFIGEGVYSQVFKGRFSLLVARHA